MSKYKEIYLIFKFIVELNETDIVNENYIRFIV